MGLFHGLDVSDCELFQMSIVLPVLLAIFLNSHSLHILRPILLLFFASLSSGFYREMSEYSTEAELGVSRKVYYLSTDLSRSRTNANIYISFT
jgi:hypothetical protein